MQTTMNSLRLPLMCCLLVQWLGCSTRGDNVPAKAAAQELPNSTAKTDPCGKETGTMERKADQDIGANKRQVVGTPETGQVEREHSRATSRHYAQFLSVKAKISHRKYRESLVEIERITASTPEEESLKLIMLGQAYEGLRDIAQAYVAYEKAQSLVPAGSVATLREGVLYYKSGDLKKAELLLRRYIVLEPGNPEASYYLFLLAGTPNEKAMFARRVVALDAENGFWSNELLRSDDHSGLSWSTEP